jgi:hypothetical protein
VTRIYCNDESFPIEPPHRRIQSTNLFTPGKRFASAVVTRNEAGIPCVMAGLVPAIPINCLSARLSEIAGTSPAMTSGRSQWVWPQAGPMTSSAKHMPHDVQREVGLKILRELYILR